jgi:hypothetical protein
MAPILTPSAIKKSSSCNSSTQLNPQATTFDLDRVISQIIKIDNIATQRILLVCFVVIEKYYLIIEKYLCVGMLITCSSEGPKEDKIFVYFN